MEGGAAGGGAGGPELGHRGLPENHVDPMSEETGNGCEIPARLRCDKPTSGRASQAGAGQGGGWSSYSGHTGLSWGVGGRWPPDSRNGKKGRKESNITTNKKVWGQALNNSTFRR